MVHPDLFATWAFGDASTAILVGLRLSFCRVFPTRFKNQKTMEIDKTKTIAFTGNRSLTSSNGLSGIELRTAIISKLYKTIEHEYLENGYTTYLSGMATGFDFLSGLAVTELKHHYPEIKFIAVIPFEGDHDRFSEDQKSHFKNLCNLADDIITISDNPSIQAYDSRNDFLISHSSKIIAYHNGTHRSGTGSAIRKALELGVNVENIY